MSGQWRRNEKADQAIALDKNAIAIQTLARSALKVDRDCRAILPRINWGRRDAANRARSLIGQKFGQYLERIVEFSAEMRAEPERVFRNIISWSPQETTGIVLAIARWDTRQTQPVLKGLDKAAIPSLKSGSIDPYWFVDKKGSMDPANLEYMIPNHPSVILGAYFFSLDGPARITQKKLVKELFGVADNLNWKFSKNSALGAISKLLTKHAVTAQFSKPMFFGLSEKFRDEIIESARSYPSLIPRIEIQKIEREIERRKGEAERRKQEANERFRQSSKYLASMVVKGDLEDPVVLDLIRKAKTSEFHERVLQRGLKGCDGQKSPLSIQFWSEISELPNTEIFLSLKLLLNWTPMYFDAFNSVEPERVSKAIKHLSAKAKARPLGEFDLQKVSSNIKLSDGGAEFVRFVVQRQLASDDEEIAKIGMSNALICARRYQLAIKNFMRIILKSDDRIMMILSESKDMKAFFETFDDSLKKAIIGKIRAFRWNNKSKWEEGFSLRIAKDFPDLIFRAKKGPLLDMEVFALVQNGHIDEVLGNSGVGALVRSPGWRRALVGWNTKSEKIPPSVIKLARTIPEIASDLTWHATRALEGRNLQRIPLEILILHGANRPERCAELGRLFSAQELSKLIPWAQRQWSDKPLFSAAMEIALAFGLKHATYLGSLSRRIRPPYRKDQAGSRFDDLYRTYEIPKKSGGKRQITEPDNALKSLQRAILDNGIERVGVHVAATGFVAGKSIVNNAQPHIKKDLVVNVDIRGFFPRTEFRLIRRAVDSIGPKTLSDTARWMLAEILSYGGALPAGAPTSPGIANIIMRPADEALFKACKKKHVDYTRYADDLTFSGTNALSILPFARDVISSLGYEFDDKKTNVFRKGRRQLVTGLVVNQKPNMARPLRKRIRAAVHARANGNSVHWDGETMSDQELLGRIAFLSQTQPEEGARLRQMLKEAMADD